MILKNPLPTNSVLLTSSGFTLLEALLAVITLAMVALGVSTVYMSGFQSLDIQAEHMLLDSQLRSRMEILVSTEFNALADGSEAVVVQGKTYTVTWTITSEDLDGDGAPEPTAKKITVSIAEIPGRTLKTIVVDNQGQVGKVS